jgi:hypothetical protein
MLVNGLRTRGVVVLLALLGACAVASPAAAATKPYSVVMSPSTVAAAANVAFTATFTNRTDQQQLGSANLTAPAGFSLVSASVPAPASATLSGNVVQLRNLALQPGASVTATVVADVPCADGTFAWSVIAKQSNNFSGPPGNDLGPLVQSSLTTVVTGGCALRFATQPANARVGEAITTTPYNVPPGGPVTVEVIDGSGSRVTTSSAVVTMSLAPGSGPGALSGTNPVTAVDGLATFANLSIGAPGSYALVASSPGRVSATSGTFRVDESATVCSEDVTCTATSSNANTTLDASAPSNAQVDAGVLVVNRNIGDALDCAGYDELSAGDFAVDFLPSVGFTGREKVVGLTISKAAMSTVPNNGASFLNVCFGAPFTFAVKPGTPPLQQQQGLNVGLLPDCGAFAPPCVTKRKKTPSGQGFIEARAPGGDQDPRYSG